jgi:hypothetical protein
VTNVVIFLSAHGINRLLKQEEVALVSYQESVSGQ